MRHFRKILVGVDLSQGDKFVSDLLPPPTQEAIERSLWLAKLNSAHITYLFSLDVSATTERLLEEAQGSEPTVIDEAKSVLQKLVANARQQDVEADYEVRVGKSWLEIIRQVLLGEHDLVVSGTRHLPNLQGLILGSTGIKLLRKCPCPVWITQPQPKKEIKAILVAHCLREVGDLAMELGCEMAELHQAQIHVLHSLELLEPNDFAPGQVPAESATDYRKRAKEHIDSQLARHKLTHAPQVHIVTDPPGEALLEYVQNHAIELIVLGTVARSGIAGLITGNTAERLLPQIPCSVLAVKPSGFISPVAG